MEFITMPWSLYRDDPHWVPPLVSDQKAFLDPRRGVFFDHGEAQLLLARRAAGAVGRLSAHVNFSYDEAYGAGTGFFGFFECEKDSGTAAALFEAAFEYLRSKGRHSLLGPMNFGVYDEIGIVVDGFDSDPYVMNLHNPPYYGGLLEALGFEKAIDWYAYRAFLKDHTKINPKLYVIRDRVLQREGFRLRQLDLHHVKREAALIKRIFSSAWAGNWGHVRWTEREYARLVDAVKRIAISPLSFIAEVEGEAVGCAISIADANVAVKRGRGRFLPFALSVLTGAVRRTDRFRHIIMGVMEEHRNRGIEIAMYAGIVENAVKLGYREMEMSLILENNYAMRNSLKHFPVEIYKTYRIYRKEI
jgi:GNAT superfamily N-acetyltransferase